MLRPTSEASRSPDPMRFLPTVLSVSALATLLVGDTAYAIDTMEAVGAEKCGGPVKSYEVEFLAPDNAGTVKALVNGVPATEPTAASLSIDGRPCTNARCTFDAKKGQNYKFAASTELPRVENLCIVVARP
jgi:hypothetical protein